jgi:ion channel-forming bestrophin family protein
MIIREKHNWLRMLFVWRGSILKDILPRLSVLFIFATAVVYFRGVLVTYNFTFNPVPFTFLGIALAIFLGFRNTASYDRFWEARKLWGALLITSRSLMRQAITMSGLPAGSQQIAYFAHLVIAFTYALKHQLRQTDASADLARLLPAPLAAAIQPVQYKPIRILQELGNWVGRGKQEGHLDAITQIAFDHNLNELSTIVGGCERIAGTPIPYPYSLLLHRTVYAYCYLLPFGLVETSGWTTPLFVALVGYAFMGLDVIVNEIEEPFGLEPNDLALNAMSRTIETSILEMVNLEAPAYPETPNQYRLD